MPRSAKSVSTEYVAALVIALAMALLAGCDGSGGIVAGDQDTPIDFGETDTTKQLDIQNTSDQDVTFELLINYGDGPKDWLTYGPITAECGPAQSIVFTLEADRSVLPAGLWEAEVVVTSGAIRKSVMISIAVVAAATSIDTHSFGTSSEPLEFAVWNAGGGALQYEVAEVPAWLAVENGTGTSTGPADRKTVTLSPNRSGLKPGTYSDQVVILPVNGLSAFRKTIDVTMTVLPPGVPALTIEATPTSGNAPLEVQFKAMNGSVLADSPTAGYTINWDFGDDTTVGQGNQVSHRFASSGTFLVTLSLAGALGTFNCHEATVTVNSDPAQPGALVVTPTDYAMFAGPPGGPFTPTGVTYTLKNTGGKNIGWSAGTAAPSWVSLSKSSGTLAGGATDTVTVKVNTNANTMVVGNYSGGVVFVNASNGAVITTRTVSLKITPIAMDDSYSVNEDKTLNVMAVAGVLANDPGHGQLPAVLVSGPSYGPSYGPSHGSITLNPNGSFSYSPAANFNGSDSFRYKLSDGTLSSNTATVNITVKPVNDPPGFAVPANQSMSLNSTIQVAMSSVSPGPADEASQTIAFTATSSNQAVVPNASLVFADSQLTITAIGTGSATITVTAKDDGGTTNSGADTTTKTFGVTAFDGVPISGTISLVETVGARPRFGQHGLKFTGTGTSAGQNYTTLTDVDGHYTQPVPEAWTGTITAQDPSRMVFLDPVTKAGYDQNGQDVSVREITTPVARPGLAGQDILAWTAPIGIPGPEFGIRETHWMYKLAPGETRETNPEKYYDYGSGPEPYHDAGNGPYTHYVNNTDPNATDTNNPLGTPAKPRSTIPGSYLPAGSIVEVHGGPYNYSSSGRIPVFSAGSTSRPVMVRGVPADSASRPYLQKSLSAYGSYIIIESLELVGCGFNTTTSYGPVDHLVLRHCEVAGGVSVCSWASGKTTSEILVYNDNIHTNGPQPWNDPQAGDVDAHGVSIKIEAGGFVRDVWVVDSLAYHHSGNFVQIGDYGLSNDAIQRAYLGRNEAHHNRQSAIGIKRSTSVIVSQNVLHGNYLTQHANPSAGVSYQYSPENLWIIYNRIYDSNLGIKSGSGSSTGGPAGLNSYIVGNTVYDIHASVSSPNSSWGDSAMCLVDNTNRYVINNTIHDAPGGFYCPSSNRYYFSGNIISSVTPGYYIYVEVGAAATSSTLRNCLFYSPNSTPRIIWGATQGTLATVQAATGKGQGCLEADPLFVSSADGDFHLQTGSPAIDTGLDTDVYSTFETLYGIDIRVDADGKRLPVGQTYDIGAVDQ